jgi:DNA polymerase iota
MDARVIIQLDLDYFYAQYEASINPSLRNQPFAIQQKHIVVTCNYLARAAGVGKLQLLTDAKKACENLIIINGEDITRYRACSKRIFKHVRALLGGDASLVQRLGMDELWCDVTALVDAHLANYDQSGLGRRKRFVLDATHGFEYDASSLAGHAIGINIGNPADLKLQIASHLCAYLRASIFEVFSLTSSGGISTSKLMAKLVGGEHKPDSQTILFTEAHQAYMDKIELKKIAGVGVVFLKVLYEKFATQQIKAAITEEASVQDDDLKVMDKEKHALLENYKSTRLTVQQVRTTVDKATLIDWFDEEKGGWLWNVLHCKDDAAVVPSSLFPRSISVEDSFLHCRSLDEVRTHLLDLTTDLISRMDADLTEAGRWVRFPSNLRLSPRFRVDAPYHDGIGRPKKGSRTSRSVALPAEVYDMTQSANARALSLVDGALLPLFKRMIAGLHNWDLSLLNVAVADMKEQRTTAGISTFLKQHVPESEQPLPCPEGMDESVWTALDGALQREVMRDLKRVREAEESLLGGKRARVEMPLHEQNSFEQEEEDEDEHGFLCDRCQSVVPRFAYLDHVCLP